MVKFIKRLRNILFIITFIGILTAVIDYCRLNVFEIPVFCLRTYSSKTKKESYRGLFYQASRITKVNNKEPLINSSNIEYTILTKKINVAQPKPQDNVEYSLKVSEEKNCNSTPYLLYADLNQKYYLYCINDIEILKDKEEKFLDIISNDKVAIQDILSNLDLYGTISNGEILKYKPKDKLFVNRDITIYQCNKENINDIYILSSKVSWSDDICTYKDDDFSFLWFIEEKETTIEEEQAEKEVFYEDEIYRYEFDEQKKDRIFIVTPAVRGKARVEIPLQEIIDNNILTLEQLKEKGLVFNQIDKEKERIELEEKARKEQEEKEKKEQEEKAKETEKEEKSE